MIHLVIAPKVLIEDPDPRSLVGLVDFMGFCLTFSAPLFLAIFDYFCRFVVLILRIILP